MSATRMCSNQRFQPPLAQLTLAISSNLIVGSCCCFWCCCFCGGFVCFVCFCCVVFVLLLLLLLFSFWQDGCDIILFQPALPTTSYTSTIAISSNLIAGCMWVFFLFFFFFFFFFFFSVFLFCVCVCVLLFCLFLFISLWVFCLFFCFLLLLGGFLFERMAATCFCSNQRFQSNLLHNQP